MFEVLRERDFRLLFTGQAISLIGSSVTTIALAFAVLEISHDSYTDVGLVMAAGLVPLVAFLLIGGVWADRLPRQWVMLVSDVVRFLCQAVMAWLLVSGRATIAELVVLQFLRGAAEAFFRPAQAGLVPQTVSAGRLQQANALRGLTESLGVTVGAALGGVLVATVGSGWAIGIDSLSYLASAAFLWELRNLSPTRALAALPSHAVDEGPWIVAGDGGAAVAPDGRSGGDTSFLRDLYEGWHEFRSRTWLWVMVCEAMVFHLVIIAPFMVLGPAVARQSLGGATAWGAILAALGVGQVVGGAIGLRLQPARPLLLCGWLTLLEVPLFAFFALGYGTAALVAAAALCGVSAALVNVLWETTLQEQIPADALSRVSAFDLMGSLAFYPLGMAVAGPIAAVIGVAGSFAVAGGATVASAAVQIILPDIRGVRRRSSPPVRRRSDDDAPGAEVGLPAPVVDAAAAPPAVI